MAEMIVPGTYVTVRSEGLISAGRVATGIVGVVGTAASGPIGVPVTLSGLAEARQSFGVPDDFQRPEETDAPLTLVRTLEHVYANGATTVVAVRVAGAGQAQASFAMADKDGDPVVRLSARTPGTWGNDVRVRSTPAEEDCRIRDETHRAGFDRLRRAGILPSAENRLRIRRGTDRSVDTPVLLYKRSIRDETVAHDAEDGWALAATPVEAQTELNKVSVYDAAGDPVREYSGENILYDAAGEPPINQVAVDPASGRLTFEASQEPPPDGRVVATYAVGHAPPGAGEVLVTTWDGGLQYAAGEAPRQEDGDELVASYLVERQRCVEVELSYDTVSESYTVADGESLAAAVDGSSALATAEADETHGAKLPKDDLDAYFGTGSNTAGHNGAVADAGAYAVGLESLANQTINIVVLAGQNAATMGSVLLAHLNATAETDHERIGVIGAAGSTVAEFLGHDMADPRVVVVAPGLAYPDGRTLPAAYTAAAVVGRISASAVQTSLTNKTLTVPGLAVDFNRGQQGQLIQRNVLAVVRKEGFRVLKGITSAGQGTPFSAIPTRRIVDFAKYGVRSAANPYIGRLNNVRVRSALKATLDAFLTRMVEDEALTGYVLEVSATRAQEIAGEVSVTMTILPTFSIDFIRVVMNLS